jgi:hypothetical protein
MSSTLISWGGYKRRSLLAGLRRDGETPFSWGGYNLSVGGASVITDAETPACGGPYGDRPHDRETKLGIFYAIYGEVLPVGRSPAQTCCPAIWEAWIFRSVGGSDLAGNRR